jgi:hypothetical protein
MLIKKINLKKYLLYSTALFLLSAGFYNNLNELFYSLIIFVAVILNQFMLVNSVTSLIESVKENSEVNKSNILLNFIFKTILLVTAITFGVHIMGNRVIIPVIIYIFQIFVLYFSINREAV